MNIKIFLLVFLALSVCGNVFSQKKNYNAKVLVVKNILREKGGYIEVDLRIHFDSIRMASRRTLTLVPVLKSDSAQLLLPEIWINGKNRQKVYERRKALNSGLEIYEDAYVILDVKTAGKAVDYKASIPFEYWMRNAHLYIQQDKCGCADTRAMIDENDLGEILFKPKERYTVSPFVTFITPEAEAVKDRNEIGEAFLDFMVGQYKILPDFRRNPQELAKVNRMLGEALADRNIVINGITFTGKASPEASYAYNLKLSQNRAKALQDYASARYKLKPEWLHAQSLGEDWEAFRSMVEASGLEKRADVLQVIGSDTLPDVKERMLKALQGGVTYAQLNREIFPQLRRVECRVDYTVRAFSVEEGKEVILTRPQQLSLREMFLVANTYEKGTPHFNDVFEVAVRMFPEDKVANFNAAATALSKGDLERATEYMKLCDPTNPETFNNFGVLYLMKGELERAETFLVKARELGVEEADKNLAELKAKQIDNDLFNSFGE